MNETIPLLALEAPSLKKLSSIQHAFFTRQGGVSEGCHASLNCAYFSKDDPKKVRENRRRITSYFGCSFESLMTVKNIHSNKCMLIEHPWLEHERPEADAMVTKQKKIILGTDTADCPAVLFADIHAGVIGLAHAGWKGAKNGVLESTVKVMVNAGAKPCNIVAAISPCIVQSSYEVSKYFYHDFTNDNVEYQQYFKNANKLEHYMFDLPGYVTGRLNSLNLKSIESIGLDTYNDERFFSCRRAFHRGEDDFGGHFSCIFLT